MQTFQKTWTQVLLHWNITRPLNLHSVQHQVFFLSLLKVFDLFFVPSSQTITRVRTRVSGCIYLCAGLTCGEFALQGNISGFSSYFCSQVLNPQRLRSLEKWLQDTETTLTQINGQRKYGAPPPGRWETTASRPHWLVLTQLKTLFHFLHHDNPVAAQIPPFPDPFRLKLSISPV